MSFDGSLLGFFPTPYPDEIFYSVLCRYHIRSGNPSVYQTNRELWDKNTGTNLLLPSGIERIAGKIPQQTNLTSERFIMENTIFPFLKPFIPRGRGKTLFQAMKNGVDGYTNTYNLSGFSRLKFSTQPHLRYCEQCILNDVLTYGEAYWHRVHQLPGIYICPKHKTPILNTEILIALLPSEFHSLFPGFPSKTPRSYTTPTASRLAEFSEDALWLLQKGNTLNYYEDTIEIYDTWLRAKGFRGWNGKTWHKKLYSAIVEFYGQNFLSMLNAYDTGIRPWSQRLLQHQGNLVYPIYHLLLIRFLADSATAFFQCKCEKLLPFGKAPWPCRNKICEYHLQDVIGRLALKCEKGIYKATFSCPHCGMIYRRKGAIPKERQYAGQIDVVDYGWL